MKLTEGAYAKARLRWEREYWLRLICQTEGNQRKAARLAGVNPSTVCRRMRECGVFVERP